MGLPKVTYGNYNYGAYARPTAIKYKGGLGEGLAAIGTAVGKAVVAKKQKIKEINEDSTLISGKFGTAQQVAAGQKLATEQNSNYLRAEKTEFGENFKQWKLGNISGEEYENGKASYESNLRKMGMVAEKFKGDASVDLDFKNARLTPNDELRSERREAMEKGLVLMSKEKGITYYTFETSQGTKKYTSDEIINDKNFFLPKQQYDNNKNRSYLNANSKVTSLLKTKPGLLTEKNINGKNYVVVDYENKKNEIKASLLRDPNFTAILTDPTFDAEAYYEDKMQNVTFNENGKRINDNSFTGSDAQMEEIRQNLVEELVNDVQSRNDAIALVPTPKITPPSASVIKNANAVDNYNKLLPKAQNFFKNVFPHNKKASTTDMNKILGKLQELGLTVKPNKSENQIGYDIKGPGGTFQISENSSYEQNFEAGKNALGQQKIYGENTIEEKTKELIDKYLNIPFTDDQE
tara:strand:- start:105 stop:1496 length:1392 start_codon:yes stop_codon:yes gene_type:complete